MLRDKAPAVLMLAVEHGQASVTAKLGRKLQPTARVGFTRELESRIGVLRCVGRPFTEGNECSGDAEGRQHTHTRTDQQPLTLFMSLRPECLRVVVTHDVVDLLVLPRVHDLGQDGAHSTDDEFLVNVGELHGRSALTVMSTTTALLRSVVVRVLPSDLVILLQLGFSPSAGADVRSSPAER